LQLRAVLVPEPELEALRDLVRCREDLRGDLMACRHPIGKLLLRRGLIYPGPGATWTRRHAAWLGSLTVDEPLVQTVFAEHLACHDVLHARRDRLGLVASESSSGTRRRQGAITKAGSTHARRLLVEAAWHYRRQPSLSVDLRRRQAGRPPAAIDAAWRAQLRLHRRWAHLDGARAKKRTTVAVAVARELACFVWEIANQPDL
jgi:transposase